MPEPTYHLTEAEAAVFAAVLDAMPGATHEAVAREFRRRTGRPFTSRAARYRARHRRTGLPPRLLARAVREAIQALILEDAGQSSDADLAGCLEALTGRRVCRQTVGKARRALGVARPIGKGSGPRASVAARIEAERARKRAEPPTPAIDRSPRVGRPGRVAFPKHGGP